jgi:prephenate dehydratase
MTKNVLLGISGLAGSFSEEAALLYADRTNIMPQLAYLTDMEGVLSAVANQKIEIGIFPVVNIHGGLVKPAFEAMGKYLFLPIDEIWLDVQQCLLTLPGKKFEQINTVISHPQAFNQCKKYLKERFKNAELIPWIDTAKAAKDLFEGKLPDTTAVLAPARSAELYHLEIMDRNIQDHNPNFTAFILVKRHTS